MISSNFDGTKETPIDYPCSKACHNELRALYDDLISKGKTPVGLIKLSNNAGVTITGFMIRNGVGDYSPVTVSDNALAKECVR